jgi:hypothetical protein
VIYDLNFQVDPSLSEKLSIKMERRKTMKKHFIFVIVVSVFTFFSATAFAESAKEAIRALRKLEAKIEVGISYADYLTALGDANFEAKMFLESPEAKEIWKECKKLPIECYFKCNSEEGKQIIKLYPAVL